MKKNYTILLSLAIILSLASWKPVSASNESPLARPEESAVQAVKIPVFTPAGGSYADVVKVAMQCNTENTKIYFTLDGSQPSADSSLYTGLIKLSKSTTIKAISVDEYGDPSPVATASYHILKRRMGESTIHGVSFAGTFPNQDRNVVTSELVTAGVSTNPGVESDETEDVEVDNKSQAMQSDVLRQKSAISSSNERLLAAENTTDSLKKVDDTLDPIVDSYVLELDAGWNLISIPVATTMTIEEIFSVSGSSLLIDYIALVQNGNYIELSFDNKLEPGKGYWVHSPIGGTSNSIVGTSVRTGGDIVPGSWSAIGPIAGFDWADYGLTAIWGWRDQAYVSFDFSELEYGQAYWVYFPDLDTIDDIHVPEGFDFQSIQKVQLVIKSTFPDGRVYPHAKFIVENESGRIIFNGYTDANGIFDDTINADLGEKLYYRLAAIGLPTDRVEVETASIVEESKIKNATNAKVKNATSSVKDNAVIDHTDSISASFLQDINFALPERSDISESSTLIDPTLANAFQGTNTYISEDNSDVYVTFVHEGAGYRNSFGYFTWQHDAGDANLGIPQSVAEITYVPIFPNASYSGSGGQLVSGDTVYLGQFDAGTWIGFWNVSNGWNASVTPVQGDPLSSAGIDVNNHPRWIFYSLPHLNQEYQNVSSRSLSQHIAVLWHEAEQKLVLGFEDILRTHGGCDHDFNDVVFYVSATPPDSIDPDNNPITDSSGATVTLPTPNDADNDGIDDSTDSHPNDSERAIIQASQEGRIAFEDNFPFKGDYDFNDLVLDYTLTEIQDSSYNVKEFTIEFELMAMGAAFHNAFGLLLDTVQSNIQSTELLINGVPAQHQVIESNHQNEVSLIVIPDAYDYFADWTLQTYGRFPNTWVRDEIFTGDVFQLNVVFANALNNLDWPYNPYMITQDQYNLVTAPNKRLEVHLMNYPPSERMNTSKFNTGDDASNPGSGLYFRDTNGMPWAMMLSKDWDHPEEYKDISLGYPEFVTWAMSGGVNSTNWQRSSKVYENIWRPSSGWPANDNFGNSILSHFWKTMDLGADTSSVETANGELVITGKAADIWKGTSQYAGIYSDATGDFVAEVKITYQKNTHQWAKAGIMVKNNITTSQDHICFVARTPSRGHIMQYDSNNDGHVDATKFGYQSTVSDENTASWVRLQRSGSSFTTSFKLNAKDTWTEIRTVSFPNVNATVDIGLFGVSHSNLTGQVKFDDFTFRLVN